MRKGSFLLIAAALVMGCAHQPELAPQSATDSPCRSSDLPACEAALANALHAATSTDTWSKAYIEARAEAQGGEDAWVELQEALIQAGPGAIVVLAEPGHRAETEAALRAEANKRGYETARLVIVEAGPLPSLTNVHENALMLAMARQAGIEQVSWIRDKAVVRVLGVDRLAPLTFDFAPILIQPVDGADPQTFHAVIAKGIRMDALVHEALGHLSSGAYDQAAALAVELEAMLNNEPPDSASALRAALLVRRAQSFGTQFPKDHDASEQSDTEEPEPWELGAPEQGPYASWLRVLMAGDSGTEAWAKHRRLIADALSLDRLELLDLLYNFDPVAKQKRCEVDKVPMPPDAWSGDMLFANRLAFHARAGVISPPQWAQAYDALVTEAQRSGTAWAVVPSLLYERGELPGMSARGSKSYQRVTQLTVEHLRSLERFQKTAPNRYGPSGQLAIALVPGALNDPAIAQVLHRLVEDSVKYKIAPAATAEELLETSIVLGLMGAMLPDPIRGAYLGSLRRGLDEKLRQGFAKETGWEVAAIFALHAAGTYLLGGNPDLTFAGDSITRALETDPDIQVRPIATTLARGVHYGTLIATNELEPERVGNAKLGPKRKAARDRLETALLDMAEEPATVPRVPLRQLTTLIDGLIATTALLVERSPEEANADACAEQPSARSLPEVQKNLRTLKATRDQLIRHPALRAGKSVWARRAALLALVASDILDVLQSTTPDTTAFSLPADQAREIITASLSEWTSRKAAVGVASLHAVARDLFAQDGDWQDTLNARGVDLGKVLIGATDLVGAAEGSSFANLVIREGARVLSAPDAESLSDAAPKLLDVASTLFEANQRDHGTIALLVAGALGSHDAELMGAASQVAVRHDSEAAWYLATRRAVRSTKTGSPLDAELLANGLRAITDDHCKVAKLDELIRVGQAVQRYGRGEGKSATDILDLVLRDAEHEGLIVPRVQYQLDEVLESGRTLRVTMHMTAGQGFISENSFTVGFDLFNSRPTSGMKVEMPAAVPEDAGRYYAHVASLNAIYHLLDERDGPAARDAERMFNALLHGVRLGDLTVFASDQNRWLGDLDTNIHLAAELASRRGHVILAGDLWRLIYGFKAKRPKGEAFDPPQSGWEQEQASVGLQAVASIQDMQSAVLRNRTLIGRAASCDPEERPEAPTDLDTCAAFRHAIAMWRAGVYDDPPAMRAGASEACVREATLLGVMNDLRTPADQALAPRVHDKIARVIESTAKREYLFDALVMLRQVRERQACIPALVDRAREIGRRPEVTPHGRVDWLGYTLTCPGRQADATVWEDLRLLASASERIADPEIPYRIHTAVVRYMVNQQAWEKLGAFSREAGFVRLMNQGGPGGAAMALLVQHTADVLAGQRPDLSDSQDIYDVACIRYGNEGREMVCRELGTFRNRVAREPDTNLKPSAEQLLRQVVGL